MLGWPRRLRVAQNGLTFGGAVLHCLAGGGTARLFGMVADFEEPSDEVIQRLMAVSPDIRPECIRQAGEYLDYLSAMARTWIINGDEYHGVRLQALCLAYGFQQTEIERLRVENANLRARLRT